ncbi:MAG TPA: beta-ketoacyl-ACP synthase II [bacterium]|jgi:3-oxoacyl-[acyl-carrier-protein] synthase II|nr:beta-ketoacyl-ACP synthase II [bacterium]
MRRRVVVTGLGAVTPLGNDVETFFQGLLEGRSGIGPITRWDPSRHTTHIAGMVKDFSLDPAVADKKDARRMDWFVQFAMASTQQALADAGLSDLSKLDLERFGVLIGSGIGGLGVIEEQVAILLEKGPSRVSPFLIPMLIVNMASGQVAIRWGFQGPNSAVATACATGNHALGDAAEIIRRGAADLMVAGGTEGAITPLGLAGFCSARALSTRNNEPTRASRPFDKERDGFVMGEGCGLLILEELEHAKARGARIYAEVLGYGMSEDANHITAPPEDGNGAMRAMQAALKDAEVPADSIDYVNAHGTSTPAGDKAETLAMKRVFGAHATDRKLWISSTKSMTGHLLGAAGGIEAVACVKMMQSGKVHPTVNLENPDPDCDLDYVANATRERKLKRVMSNGFGFGGVNASLVFGSFEG